MITKNYIEAGLHTLADSMSEHVMFSRMETQEVVLRWSMTSDELLDYRRYLREIADCPQCGATDVELKAFDFPDVYGTTYGYDFPCCGYSWSRNSFCEYAPSDGDDFPGDAHGKIIDVG